MKPALLSVAFLLSVPPVASAQCDSELQKLVGNPPASYDRFGAAVAMSADRLFIGSPGAGVHGEVHVYEPTASGWVRATTLLPDDLGHAFGAALAIDGDTLVVGAPWGASYAGVTYVFERGDETWRRTRRLLGSLDGGMPAEFGTTVAVSGDTIAVGSYADQFIGSVRTWVRQGTGWTAETVLWNPDDTLFGSYGGGLALDGDTMLIHEFGPPGTQHGVDHMQRVGGAWAPATGIAVTGRVGMALEGDRLVLGDQHSVRVFDRNGAGWTLQGMLDSPDRIPLDGFGWAVSIDGERVVVGAPTNHFGRGAVYVFEASGSDWVQTARFEASDGENSDRFGQALAQSAGIVVAGAPQDADAGDDTGSAYVLEATSPGTPFCAAGPNSLGQAAVLSAGGCRSIDSDGLRFAVSPVPASQAVFAYGPRTTNRPFGNSSLCVGGVLTSSMGTADAPGSFSWALDPGSAPHDQITAGSTWYFQAWFRDPAGGGPGFNLSNAVETTFLP